MTEPHWKERIFFNHASMSFDDLKELIESVETAAYSRGKEDMLKEVTATLKSKIEKRKPTHGECCTCQECGFANDYECKCENNRIIKDLLSTLEALRKQE